MKFKYGHRNYIFSTEFWKRLVKEKKLTLSYKQAKAVIEKSNEVISDVIINEQDGFKLPFGLGYLVVTKFIPKNAAIDWNKSNKLGKRVYFTNLHTLGYSVRVIWYSFDDRRSKSDSFRKIYMFKTSRYLSRKLNKSFSSGKVYMEWGPADYVNKGMLEKFYREKIENTKIREENV